ncbi:3'-5' exoribonuclease YhaM [Siminovitchia sp. FSL H7-0308]|uniref:3'-5' exoribonuclease n=1 Tax=Siminovitchia thermophila TaxID=1245522 RepID=A0ABS2R902_9BACI|nr:3'-5' exoribonuclease YhaM [Siminovitchia thermophila]MBM7715081.1 3'-5' exoribonuclease [Siminovitchia thermophila]ONK22835.1 3'-5' exoribonuclease YhaM [Bacillus sp. VT-16-64]
MLKELLEYEVGEHVDMFLLIKNAVRGIASNGKPFLTLILQDRSGDIEAKLWDASDDEVKIYQPGKIVRVAGEVHNYRGRMQLKIKQIRRSAPQDGITVADLLETAPLSKEEISSKVTQYIFEMKNPNIQRITRHLLRKYYEQFLEYPAATKNHHEFVSGLGFHVVSMLDLARSITELYPSLDRDLLYAGIILHDLGKVIELTGPVAAAYTIEGNLLGHITIMVEEIGKAAEELGIQGEEIVVLQHLVLSHHGKMEWGSPKQPMIKEAEILHLIDNLDAKMNMLDRALKRVKPGEYTEKIFPLDNRSFYKPTFHS